MNWRHWIKKLLGTPGEVSSDEQLLRMNEQIIAGFRRGGIRIGENCYLLGVTMLPDDPIEIGDDCVLTHCIILGHDAAPAHFLPELRRSHLMDRVSMKKKTVIRDHCFIGMNAIVLCGVSIGPNSIVGAGAVVTSDVPEGMVYAGNPAKFLCTIEEFKQRHRDGIAERPGEYPGL